MTEEQIEKLVAANNILAAAMATEKKDRSNIRKLSIACACISLVSCLVFLATTIIFASGIEIDRSTTTTEDTTVTQETSGAGDAVYQAGDGSQYYSGGVD